MTRLQLFGDEQTFATVACMIDRVREGARAPEVREVAKRIAGGALTSDPAGLAVAIQSFLIATCRYLDDPADLDDPTPALTSLDEWAHTGFIHGDCDDVAVLGGALARSISLGVTITVISFAEDPWNYRHTFAEILTDRAEPCSLDIFKPLPGSVPPVARQWVSLPL